MVCIDELNICNIVNVKGKMGQGFHTIAIVKWKGRKLLNKVETRKEQIGLMILYMDERNTIVE